MESFKEYKDYSLVIMSVPPDAGEKDAFITVERLIKEGKKLGIPVYFYDLNTTIIKDDILSCIDHPKGIKIDSENLLVLVRGSVTQRSSWINLVKQLERKKITCINSTECTQLCSDKYQTFLTLKDSNVPQPKSSMLLNEFGPDEYTYPLILKTTRGSKGVGVLFIESYKSLNGTVQLLRKMDEKIELMVQEYVDIKFDIRALVLNGNVQACMKRHVVKDDFRSNFSQGGEIEKYELTSDEEKMVLAASEAVQGSWVGVDFIINPKGKPLVLEVNSSAGTEGIEKATGGNLNKEFLKAFKSPKHWTKYKLECGVIERVDIPKLGPLKAKMDTGNSGKYSVIHSDEFDIKGDKIHWKIHGKKIISKLITKQNVRVGGLRDYDEKRPVISLDVSFNGVTYKDTKFTLDDRTKRSTILFNREFIIGANLLINPDLKYHLSTRHSSFEDE
jgi:ribosomal protein S6--L-glutamate ligase